MKRVVLSDRLQMIGDMVTSGSRVVDVGCDHAFLPIWLVQAGVSPGVIAMDVRSGPLSAAEEHIAAYGLGEYIETRLSDGLCRCRAGEADCCICAGMGGRLMERILREGMDKVRKFKELILQPQSEIREFRVFLRREGLAVVQEGAICEEDKYYFAMRVVPRERPPQLSQTELAQGGEEELSQEQRVYDRFGERLISEGNLVLQQFLQKRRESLERLIFSLDKSQSQRRLERLMELLLELSDVEYALGCMGARK